jgi:hypothetical protein
LAKYSPTGEYNKSGDENYKELMRQINGDGGGIKDAEGRRGNPPRAP